MSMRSVRMVLTVAGRNGPALLFGGVLIGLVAPPLADAARPMLGVAVFIFTLGAFLKVDLNAFRAETRQRTWIVGVLLWTTFGVPLTMLALLRVSNPEPVMAQAMLLCMLAPPVGSAAAIAAMVGLSAPLALLATVAATTLSPIYLPPLASALSGYDLQIDPFGMAQRLVLIVGGACLCAALLRRFAGRFVSENPHAMTGIAVLGLILVAIGAMRGMQEYFLDKPYEVARFFLLAFAVNAGFQAIGTLLFWHAGRLSALSIGLVSGNRSVTLVWAAAGATLMDAPKIELYFAMSVFPIFMMPVMTRWIIAQLLLGADEASTFPTSIPPNPRDREEAAHA
jgi:predicted Na+-dependent transporter